MGGATVGGGVMAEAGIDISEQRPKHWDAFLDQPWDLVVTVCDAARESRPLFPTAVEGIHISFPDPILAGAARRSG